MRESEVPIEFPGFLPEPRSYFAGVGEPTRPRTGNVIVFLRSDRGSLQQRDFANRSHHRYVLLLVLQTEGAVIIDGDEVRLKEGEGLLIRPFQFHHYINLEEDELRWLFITFELEAGGAHLPEFDGYVLKPNRATLELWSELAHTWRHAEGRACTEVIPMLDLLLLKLSETVGGNPASVAKRAPSWIAQVEALLIESIHNHWTFEEIADRLGISTRRLRTLFEANTGVTMRRYRANYQLHRAMALMSDSGYTLAQVAERCGFQSASVFTRFIRRETQLSPRDLKARLSAGPPI